MTLFEAIEGLTQYAVDAELIYNEDKIYCRNNVLELLNIVNFEKSDVSSTNHFDCLKVIVDYAFEPKQVTKLYETLELIPHKKIIQRYRNMNSKILRTDLNGAIILSSDGINYTIKSVKGD